MYSLIYEYSFVFLQHDLKVQDTRCWLDISPSVRNNWTSHSQLREKTQIVSRQMFCFIILSSGCNRAARSIYRGPNGIVHSAARLGSGKGSISFFGWKLGTRTEGSGQRDIYCLPAKYFIGILHEGQTSVWDGHHLLHTVQSWPLKYAQQNSSWNCANYAHFTHITKIVINFKVPFTTMTNDSTMRHLCYFLCEYKMNPSITNHAFLYLVKSLPL